MEKNSKIYIAGHDGFVGSAIVKNLQKNGYTNLVFKNYQELDLRDKKAVEAFFEREKPEYIFNAAAITGNAELHRSHPADIFYDNALMGIQLLKTASESGVKKFVMIGSATEYPDEAPLPLREDDLWNGFPEVTHAPYSIVKRALLTYGQACHAQYGISVVHPLMTSMYGPGAAPGSGPIPSFIERIDEAKRSGDETVSAWGTGKPLRDLLYIDDAAEAIVLAAERYDGVEPVNVGSGTEISIADLAKRIAALMDFKGTFVFDPTKSDGKMRRVLDTTKAEHLFGFRAQTDLEEGLRRTIKWYNGAHER